MERKISPLDQQRTLDDTVINIDRIVRLQNFVNKQLLDNHLSTLEKGSPYLGSLVEATGTALKAEWDEEIKVFSFRAADKAPDTTAIGIYNGYGVLGVWDERNIHNYRIVHKIGHPLKSKGWVTAFTERFERTWDLVCVEGGRILPAAPHDAHSLADLAMDDVAEGIDDIVLNGEEIDIARLKELGSLIMKSCLQEQGTRLSVISRSRLSYLNRLGVLDGRYVVANKFLFGNLASEHDYFREDTTPAVATVTEEIVTAQHFLILPRTKIMVNGNEVSVSQGGDYGLHISGNLDDGQLVAVSIDDVEDII